MNNTAPAVLIVDDDDPLRRMLAAALTGFGFRVLAATDGQEALALYRQHGGDVSMVLLDVGMPGLDGPATLCALRGIDPGVRCCFMSADPAPYTAESLLAMGAERYFAKPFSLGELSRSLWELLREGHTV